MDNKALSLIVSGFIVILVGIIFLDTIANNINAAVTTSLHNNESITMAFTSNTVTNETITLISGVGNTQNISVVNITYFGNVTNNTDMPTPTLLIGTHVNWTQDGVVLVVGDFATDTQTYNISYIWYSGGTGQTEDDDLLGVSYFGDSDISTDSTGIAIDSEINWTVPGVITIVTTNFTNSSAYDIIYTYESDDYVKNSTARVLMPLINIFFAIAILMLGVGLAIKGFKLTNFF